LLGEFGLHENEAEKHGDRGCEHNLREARKRIKPRAVQEGRRGFIKS
jgi:hypothetical protein